MEKLITEVTAMGVNIDRIYDFVRAQSQAQQQTAAAVQEEYNDEEEADDAADFDLSAAFGE